MEKPTNFLPGDIVIANIPPRGKILCLYATQEPDKTHKLLVPDEQGKLHVLYVHKNERLELYRRPMFHVKSCVFKSDELHQANREWLTIQTP